MACQNHCAAAQAWLPALTPPFALWQPDSYGFALAHSVPTLPQGPLLAEEGAHFQEREPGALSAIHRAQSTNGARDPSLVGRICHRWAKIRIHLLNEVLNQSS